MGFSFNGILFNWFLFDGFSSNGISFNGFLLPICTCTISIRLMAFSFHLITLAFRLLDMAICLMELTTGGRHLSIQLRGQVSMTIWFYQMKCLGEDNFHIEVLTNGFVSNVCVVISLRNGGMFMPENYP